MDEWMEEKRRECAYGVCECERELEKAESGL